MHGNMRMAQLTRKGKRDQTALFEPSALMTSQQLAVRFEEVINVLP